MTTKTIKHKIVIDFIDVRIKTTKQTQAMHLYKRLGLKDSFVTGCDPQTLLPYPPALGNTTTDVFICRIQAPKNLKALETIIGYLGNDWDKTVPICPTMLEIALDTYVKGATLAELAAIATSRLMWAEYSQVDLTGRYFYRKGGEGREYTQYVDEENAEGESLLSVKVVSKLFEDQWQFADTDDKLTADCRTHIHVKTTDSNVKALPVDKYRVRYEMTLQGNALPCQSIDDLRSLLPQLARYFKFRRLSAKANIYSIHNSQHFTRHLGKRGAFKRPDFRRPARYNGMSIYRHDTESDKELNAKAYDGLRYLARS